MMIDFGRVCRLGEIGNTSGDPWCGRPVRYVMRRAIIGSQHLPRMFCYSLTSNTHWGPHRPLSRTTAMPHPSLEPTPAPAYAAPGQCRNETSNKRMEPTILNLSIQCKTLTHTSNIEVGLHSDSLLMSFASLTYKSEPEVGVLTPFPRPLLLYTC